MLGGAGGCPCGRAEQADPRGLENTHPRDLPPTFFLAVPLTAA